MKEIIQRRSFAACQQNSERKWGFGLLNLQGFQELQDRRPEVKALAQEQYDMRFGRRQQEMQLDDMDEFDEDEFEEME